MSKLPILVAERYKARVCGRLLAGIACSNSAWGMEVCYLVSAVYCHVKASTTGRSLAQRSPID
jgi:hypothetical protein